MSMYVCSYVFLLHDIYLYVFVEEVFFIVVVVVVIIVHIIVVYLCLHVH